MPSIKNQKFNDDPVATVNDPLETHEGKNPECDVVSSLKPFSVETPGNINDLKEANNDVDKSAFFSYGILTGSLRTNTHEISTVHEDVLCSAPPLKISTALEETIHEFKLPQCYSVNELKNFYTNQSADAIGLLEDVFLKVGLHLKYSNKIFRKPVVMILLQDLRSIVTN